MPTTMRRHSIMTARAARRARLAAAGISALTVTLLPSLAGAQAPAAETRRIGEAVWRITAAAGGYVPRSSLIVGADGRDTRLGAGPSFSLDVQYLISDYAAGYANGTLGFSTITLGSSIRPSTVGPSNQVMLMGGTAGVVLSAPLATRFHPTLRLGGGFKGYSFDLTDAENQWRPTADIGVGFRGLGAGPIEMGAEVRYLASSFDQGKMPIRGITPQAQRQTDLVFSVGVSIRP
jgi:hypothetical protein